MTAPPRRSEYYGLLLIAGCGMVYMAAARELITAYISLELLSFSLYILVGYLKRDNLSSEASLKYILLGAFSSAMFLYGMSLIYGVTGTTYYDGIAEALAGRDCGTDAGGRRRLHAHPRRCRLQGLGRALPHVGARCLRRRAAADHRVPLDALEGGRLRAHPAPLQPARSSSMPPNGAGRSSSSPPSR